MANMTNISPTPWKTDGLVIRDADNMAIAIFRDNLLGTGTAIDNVKLAAAAPELLAMVKELADDIRKKEQLCALDPVLCDKCMDEKRLILKADKLIEKVEGENE